MLKTLGQNGKPQPTEGASPRPRLLLVAYGCSPGRGSEAGVGWNRAVQAARVADTWVLCEETEFAADVRRYRAAQGEIPGLHFQFVPQRRWESYLWRVPGLGYLAYNLWQRRALVVARRLHEKTHFDLVHQLTFATFREPGYMGELGVPWIWGPFGGTQNYPWQFLAQAGVLGAACELARSIMNRLQLRLSPRIRRAARRAAMAIAANSSVQEDFHRAFGVSAELLSDVGISAVAAAPAGREGSGPLRILWAGHLNTRKALSLLIEALARLPADVRYEVRIVGDGPAKQRWQRLARRRGVAANITWMGRLTHQDALQAYVWADVFVFTSLRDTTGCVVVEALGNGLPVICLDHQGVHDVVTEQCGIKIPVTTPSETIDHLTGALATLARNPAERQRLGRGARARSEHYLWSRQGERMAALYRRVLAAGAGQPAENAADNRAFPGVVHFRRAALLAAGPLDRLLPRPRQQGFNILLYHRMVAPIAGLAPPTCNVAPAQFRAQMRGLLDRGYTPWPLRRVLDCHRAGRPIPPRTFVVTFDDGYANTYHNAWPILRELGIAATVFLTTGCLDSSRPFPFDDWPLAGAPHVPAEAWRPLSAAECAEMLAGGLIDLGSHTHTHADFSRRPNEFRQDLELSLASLSKHFGLARTTFAFPFGHCNAKLRDEAKRAGMLCALTTIERPVTPQTDPFDWGRITVAPTDTAVILASKLDGWYQAARDAWHDFRRRRQPGFPAAESFAAESATAESFALEDCGERA